MSSGPSRSSSDLFDTAIDAAAIRVLEAADSETAPVVLIDGRSGSGKTTLAARLSGRCGGRAQVVALDHLYPGWDGLDAGVEEARRILVSRARGQATAWRRWDWDAAGWAESHSVTPDLPLIVEGSGLLTRGTAPLAGIRVWLSSPADTRKARALARDGEVYRPHWDRWAAQEERHLDRDEPERLATHVFEIP